MINAIAAANAARSPVLVLASNMTIANEDTEAGIQLGYQQPTTEGLKKYGKRLITPKRIHEYGAYAFRQLRTGVPRPAHLDFPAEVTRARFEKPGDVEYYYDKAKYRTTGRIRGRRTSRRRSNCSNRPSARSSFRATASFTAAPGTR